MSDELGQGTVDGLPFVKIIGSSLRVGPPLGHAEKLITYTVYVEEGTTRRRREFARTVDAILADERSWIRGGKVAFQRVAEGANTQCVLALPKTVDKLCYPLNTEGQVSCCQGTKVVINSERWKHAVEHWPGSLETYRQMVVNHEFGHRIGKPHRWCGQRGDKAAVMQQQTYSLQGCKANSWPLDSEL